MSTLSSVPEDLEKFKNSPSVKTLESLGELLKLAEPYMKKGVHEDWQEFIAAVQCIPHEVDRAINQQIKSVLDELESELDDGKNSHSMKVISSAIQKIRSRYE